MKNIHTFYTCKMQAIIDKYVSRIPNADPENLAALQIGSEVAALAATDLAIAGVEAGLGEPSIFEIDKRENEFDVQWRFNAISVYADGRVIPWWSPEKALSNEEIIEEVKRRLSKQYENTIGIPLDKVIESTPDDEIVIAYAEG